MLTVLLSVRGRPHYYSPKKEEYAHIRFDLDAGKLVYGSRSHLPYECHFRGAERKCKRSITDIPRPLLAL